MLKTACRGALKQRPFHFITAQEMQMTSHFSATPSTSRPFFRLLAWLLASTILLFLLNRYFAYWHNWPGLVETLGFFSSDSEVPALQWLLGIAMYGLYIAALVLIIWHIKRSPGTSLRTESRRFASWSYFVIRAAFWSVLLVGLADAIISFMRIEAIQPPGINANWWAGLDQARTRGLHVHYPLMLLALVIAWFTRSLGFIWLSLLVVLAELGIVLSRFIFSYEQAFMGDLVRFWYAALFLFASAYTLVADGHVRVDILYTNFKPRRKAWVNGLGSLLLGLPLCWTILIMGMGTPQSSLISPILSFEISQSGYGMYVRYLMAGFLLVFAVSMALIFVSYFLDSVADLNDEEPHDEEPA